MIWARADRQARMRVDYSSVESFKTVIASASGDASPDDDFTSKLLLDDLPPGQDIFYRVRFDDIATGIAGESRIGHFRTAPAAGQSISFLWSGDTAGQGWGIDTSRGGYRSYRTMLDNRPDFFIHSGDHIYADCTIPSEQKLPNGEIWRNVVTEEKSEVRAHAGAVPRQLQIQPSRRALPRLPRRGADVCTMGRPRGHQRLVADRQL
ncbi:phosphodiesterase/alkaline phosphatase D-like protein [Bradyrhizobium sp. GM5.1]